MCSSIQALRLKALFTITLQSACLSNPLLPLIAVWLQFRPERNRWALRSLKLLCSPVISICDLFSRTVIYISAGLPLLMYHRGIKWPQYKLSALPHFKWCIWVIVKRAMLTIRTQSRTVLSRRWHRPYVGDGKDNKVLSVLLFESGMKQRCAIKNVHDPSHYCGSKNESFL